MHIVFLFILFLLLWNLHIPLAQSQKTSTSNASVNDSDALNKIWVLFDSHMPYNFFASILSSFEYGSKIWLILANIVFEYYRLFLFSVHIFSL